MEGTLDKSQHRKLTLEKKILLLWDSNLQPFDHKSSTLSNKLSRLSHSMTASPKPSFRAPGRVDEAVVDRRNVGWTTSKSWHPCPCLNCSQGPPAKKRLVEDLCWIVPRCLLDDPIGQGTEMIWTMQSLRMEIFTRFLCVRASWHVQLGSVLFGWVVRLSQSAFPLESDPFFFHWRIPKWNNKVPKMRNSKTCLVCIKQAELLAAGLVRQTEEDLVCQSIITMLWR